MSTDLIKQEGKKVSGKKRLSIYLNINVTCIATSMLGTALTTALPPIMEEFHIAVDTGQWLTSGFTLFLAVMTPLTGYLISRFKTKILYCTAVTLFIIGLIFSAASKAFYVMMIGRIIQGCGNGILSSLGQVIIISIYPPEKIGIMMGWYGLSIGVSPIISPTIAGLIVDYIGWRTIFYISISIMTVALIWAIVSFEDVLPTMRKRFDPISFILSALAFGGVTFAAGNLGSYDFFSYQVIFFLIVGVLTGIIFSLRQVFIKVPFLDIRVLNCLDFAVSLSGTIIIQLVLMGASIILPIYVQQIQRKSATISGLMVLPGSFAMAIVSPLSGRIYDKIGMKIIFIVGSLLLIIGHLIIYFINVRQSIWVVSTINIIRCIGLSTLMMPIVTWAMKDVPSVKVSDATALYNSFRYIGGAIGTALFTSIMTKVAKTIGKNKESPPMYGVNVAFLAMAGFSFIILLLGLFGCKSPFIDRDPNKLKQKKENQQEDSVKKVEMVEKDITNVDIVISNQLHNNDVENEKSKASDEVDKQIQNNDVENERSKTTDEVDKQLQDNDIENSIDIVDVNKVYSEEKENSDISSKNEQQIENIPKIIQTSSNDVLYKNIEQPQSNIGNDQISPSRNILTNEDKMYPKKIDQFSFNENILSNDDLMYLSALDFDQFQFQNKENKKIN